MRYLVDYWMKWEEGRVLKKNIVDFYYQNKYIHSLTIRLFIVLIVRILKKKIVDFYYPNRYLYSFTICFFIVLIVRVYIPGLGIPIISILTLINIIFIIKFIRVRNTFNNNEEFEKNGIKLFFSIGYFYLFVLSLYPNNYTFIIYIIIGLSFLYFTVKYIAFRKLNIWWKYIPAFGLLLIPSFFLIGFMMVPLQVLYGINDKTFIGVIFIFAIVVPIIVTIFEKEEKLNEIKVALFCISAIATTISSIVFLFDDFLIEATFNYVLQVDILEEDIFEQLRQKEADLETFESIGLENFAKDYYTLAIVSELKNEISNFIDLVIKLLFLPPVVTTVWCFFIIELRNRNVSVELK